MPILFQFSDEFRLATKKGVVIRLLFESESPDNSLKEKVKKLFGKESSIHIKFHREPLNQLLMSDDKEALITTAKQTGLGESPCLWTNNCNLIGVLRTSFESDWKKAED